MPAAQTPSTANPPGWHVAACTTDPNPDAWFPDTPEGPDGRYAKQVCAGCRLIAACATYALQAGEQNGIWGGLDPQQRHRLRINAKGGG